MNYHKSRHTFNDVAKLPHTLFRGRRNLFRNEIEKFYGDFYSPQRKGKLIGSILSANEGNRKGPPTNKR